MTRSKWSIRTRLTAWYVVVLAGILAGYVTAVFIFQYALLERQMYHDEVQDVETVEGLLYFNASGQLQLQQNYFSHPQSHLLVDRLMEVRDLSGGVLYRSETLGGMELGEPSLPDEGGALFNERTVTLHDGTRVFMISHRHPVNGRPLLIRLGYSLAPLAGRMRQFVWLLLLAVPVALILAALAGHFIAKRAFAPLNAMAARAEQITASNLHDRLLIENPHDELGHIGRVFNHLLERLDQAFSQLRHFTADAAHELRTPLAALRAAGEVAIESGASSKDCREAISSMLEETIRLNQTIDGLLILSNTEVKHGSGSHTIFNLADVVREILILLEVVIEERSLHVLEVRSGAPISLVEADRSFIRIAILNVLHNAIKFAPHSSTVTVTYGNGNVHERLMIQDEGPGIPTGAYQRVFERFYTAKLPGTLVPSGTGLGLSIARLAIERSGGRIWFDEHITTGAACHIELPKA